MGKDKTLPFPSKVEEGVTLYDVSRPGGCPTWLTEAEALAHGRTDDPGQKKGEKEPAKAQEPEK